MRAGNYPAIMREKEALIDPMTAAGADAQIGSGPYKFARDQWKPGDEVVYVKNADYVPRAEAPDGMAGGRQAKVDRLIFKIIPDPQTAASALLKGEVDFIDSPAADVLPQLEKSNHSKARSMPKRRAAASSTRTPSGITSVPMPSPGMTAMRCRDMVLALRGRGGSIAICRDAQSLSMEACSAGG